MEILQNSRSPVVTGEKWGLENQVSVGANLKQAYWFEPEKKSPHSKYHAAPESDARFPPLDAC